MHEALSIFNVKADQRNFNFNALYSSDHFKKSIKIVAKAAKVEEDALQQQFEDVHPRAVQLASSTAGSTDVNKSSWKSAIAKINAHTSVAMCHPTDVIKRATALYHLWGASSSGVEQDFSRAEWGFGNRRQSALVDTEEAVMRVLLELTNHDKDMVIKTARQVWSHLYGYARLTRGVRIDKGVPRRQADSASAASELPDTHGSGVIMAHSETEFIRRRRAAVAAVSSGMAPVDLDADALMASATGKSGGWVWGDTHAAELAFQKRKLRARKLQAVAEGILEGDTQLVIAEVELVKKARLKLQQQRNRKHLRSESRLQGKTTTEFLKAIQGKRVYVDNSVSGDSLEANLSRWSMTKASMHDADVVIVPTPGQTGERVALVTGLRGAYQITHQLLSSNGSVARHGVGVKWHAVAQVPRVVYVSQACYDSHKNTVDLIGRVLASMPSRKMELVLGADWAKLTELRTKFASTPARVIAVVRVAEKTTQPVT